MKSNDNNKVSLKQALKQIEDVAQHIEERLKEYEMAKVMLNIQKSLAGNQPNIIAPGRRLLKQGRLMKVPRAGGTHGQQRYFVLFSDTVNPYTQFESIANPAIGNKNVSNSISVVSLFNMIFSLYTKDLSNFRSKYSIKSIRTNRSVVMVDNLADNFLR